MGTTLKSVLEATTDALTLNPGRAQVELSASGRLVGACEFEARVQDWTVTVDEPPALGGTNQAPNPLQMALVALGSCQAITYRLWAEKLGMQIDDVEVITKGTTDVRGLLGAGDMGRTGLSRVSVDIRLRGPEDDEAYKRLRRTVDAHCPVLDVFTAPLAVTTTVTKA